MGGFFQSSEISSCDGTLSPPDSNFSSHRVTHESLTHESSTIGIFLRHTTPLLWRTRVGQTDIFNRGDMAEEFVFNRRDMAEEFVANDVCGQ